MGKTKAAKIISSWVRVYLAFILGIGIAVGVFASIANARAMSDLRSSLADGFEVNTAIDELRLLSSHARLLITASAAAGTTSDLPNVDRMTAEFVAIATRLAAMRPVPVELRERMSAVQRDGRAFVDANTRQEWAAAADLSSRFEESANQLQAALLKLNGQAKADVAAKLSLASADLRKRNAWFAAAFVLCIALGLFLSWSLHGRLTHEVAERERMQNKLLLADRMVSLGTLAAGVAHEINNPLAYTIANLEYIGESLRELDRIPSAVDVPGVRAALKDAVEGAERVRRIVKDMKTLSRVDDGKMAMVDVEQALDASVNMAARDLRHKARIVKEYARVGFARANEGQLVQVFVNLLVNASHAIAGSSSDNEVRIATSLDGEGRIAIEIADTGSGIPDEVLPRIFDPFFTTKPIGVGTGLGLSICHSLLTGMGGQIEVTSKVGVGTRFRITLCGEQPEVPDFALGLAARAAADDVARVAFSRSAS
jgi:signal transduction histidine kinase